MISLFAALSVVSGSVFCEETKNPDRQAAEKVVVSLSEPKALKAAMLETLRRHPEANRWGGMTDGRMFGIGVVTFTDRDIRDGDIGMLRKAAKLIAAKEMLLTKVLLDKYAETGLDDPKSLRHATLEANEAVAAQIFTTYRTNEAVLEGKRIVGVVVADQDKIVNVMTTSDRIDAVRTSYRDVVHRQVKRLIAEDEYDNALRRLMKLRRAKLLNRELLFEVLTCFVGLDRPNDTTKIAKNLLVGHEEDAALYQRLVLLVLVGKSDAFAEMAREFQLEIALLNSQELSAEEAFGELLDELGNP